MKIRHFKHRPRWRLTSHLYGLYGMCSLRRWPFWMVRKIVPLRGAR
ncbi:hypothetical protein [Burkholderia ubonensis]|nr:hypothetical protein [Burkholderia ubonensis]